MRAWPAVAVLAGVAVTAACSGPPTGPGAGPDAGSTRGGTSAAPPRSSHPHLTAADGAGATPVSGPPGVSSVRVRTADGSLITVVVFHGDLRFVLHDGSQGPADLLRILVGPRLHHHVGPVTKSRGFWAQGAWPTSRRYFFGGG
jgi:hypothetical protein